MRKRLSLKVMLITLIILVGILPSVILMSLYWTFEHKYRLDIALSEELHSNEMIQQNLEKEVKRYVTLLQNKSDPIAFSLSRVKDNDLIPKLLKIILEREAAIHGLLLISVDGDIIAAEERGFNHGEPLIKENENAVNKWLKNHWNISREKNSLSPELLIPQHGRIYIGGTSFREGEHRFVIAIPVGDTEKTDAILLAEIEVSNLWQYHAGITSEEGIISYLIDQRGSLLTKVGDFQSGQPLTHLEVVRSALSEKLWDVSHIYKGFSGVPVYSAVTPVQLLNWTIISEIPVSRVTDPIRKDLKFASAIALGLVSIFILLGFWLAKQLMVPVNRLTRDMKLFEKGENFKPIDKTIIKEFDTMLSAFKKMVVERTKMEKELRSSEAMLANAQHLSHLGNWELDLETNQLEWSDEIYCIFGIDPRDFNESYESFLELVHPDDREKVTEAYKTSIKDKTPYRIEHRLCIPDGSIKYVEERCETFYNHAGRAIRSIGTIQDITERRQAEQLLVKANRSLTALSKCNEILVRASDESELLKKICQVIVEEAGYHLAWVAFAEYDEEKTIKPMAQAGYEQGYLETLKLTWADTERGQGPTGTAIRTGKPSCIRNIIEDPRYKIWRDAALERGYHSSIALPLTDKGQTFGALNIYSSETDAFAEEEIRLLEEMADDLAYGIVTLRSHDERQNLNQQLQQAQKMEVIGQLTGGIAHDFNNILASILGFTSLALQRFVDKDQPELRDYLKEVLHAGERARDLVSQLLAFSRTGSSKSSPLPLSPMIKEVSKMLQATLPSSIQLYSKIDEDVPAVMMDPVQLQQVLMNLCINARDATGDKGRIGIEAHYIDNIYTDRKTDKAQAMEKIICTACHHEIKPESYVELSVHDTGTGISQELLARIFEPFFTTKKQGQGTGMGLSMVHGIIHQYNGHILVDTDPDFGTKFRLLIPASRDESFCQVETEGEENLTDQDLNNARILIVDDEESVARFMGDLFDSRGGKVTILTDSQAALDLFRYDPMAFDLVITDQTMPGMSGIELARILLTMNPKLPVILCTGYSENVDQAKAHSLGIQGYISKPMEINTLFNLAVKLLAGKQDL